MPTHTPKNNNARDLKLQIINKDNIDTIYFLGLTAHQNGDFSTARKQYMAVLQLHPTHIKSLYLLGTLYCQLNELEQGIEYLNKTITLVPNHAEAHSSLGNALNQLHRFDEALKHYNLAININHSYSDAYHNQGITLVNLKRNNEAIASFAEAIRLKPDFTMAYFEKGNAELSLNHYQKAIDSFKNALNLHPGFFDAIKHLEYAQRALDLSDNKNATRSVMDQFELDTQNLNDLLKNGESLDKLNLIESAIAHFNEAVKRYPDAVNAHILLGGLYKKKNLVVEALYCFDCAIKLQPNNADALRRRADIYCRTNRLQDALDDYESALSSDGDLYNHYFCIGFTYRCLNLFDQALENYRLWDCLKDKRHSKVNHALAHFSESFIWLIKGHFELGLQLYESRWEAGSWEHYRHFKEPLWLGDKDISNKHILLHAEQGLGDTVQMFRYVDLVARMAAKVTLEVQSSLTHLLRHNTTVNVISRGDILPKFDVQCPLMSLPLAFKTSINNIAAIKKITLTDEDTCANWSQKIKTKINNKPAALKIGFAATGNTKHVADFARSITFKEIVAFLPQEHHVFCLQKDIRPEDGEFLMNHEKIYYFGKQLKDFSDTAAVIENMDIVITVDTSIAHLAASMGKPTWILLPFSPDFRWLLDRDDSPWYPTVKLFRQSKAGDWKGVLKRIQSDLTSLKINHL